MYVSITIKILKRISKFIVDPLAFIYNLSIELSIFSDKLKIANIKPLFKNADGTNMNYKPLSMLSNFSKTLEKIIQIRLIHFMEKINYCQNTNIDLD